MWLGRRVIFQTFEEDLKRDEDLDQEVQQIRHILDEDNSTKEQSC
jgi:hypothetical protein